MALSSWDIGDNGGILPMCCNNVTLHSSWEWLSYATPVSGDTGNSYSHSGCRRLHLQVIHFFFKYHSP